MAVAPGGGYLCDVDLVAKYVAVTTRSGTLVHEGSFYKTLADIEKARIKAPLVPGSHPWGKPEEGFQEEGFSSDRGERVQILQWLS